MNKFVSIFIAGLLSVAVTNGVEKMHKGINKMIEPDIDIKEKDRALSADVLNRLLADEYVLLVKTLNYHWNLVGPEFHDYHILFDGQYKMIFELTDQVAERTRSIGGIALGSMAEFIKNSGLKENSGDIPAPQEMVANLLRDHEALIKSVRDGIAVTGQDNRDMGTNNFLAGLIEKHEKAAWMLRSLLERRK